MGLFFVGQPHNFISHFRFISRLPSLSGKSLLEQTIIWGKSCLRLAISFLSVPKLTPVTLFPSLYLLHQLLQPHLRQRADLQIRKTGIQVARQRARHCHAVQSGPLGSQDTIR